MLAIMNSKLCVCVTVNCYSQWKRSEAKRSEAMTLLILKKKEVQLLWSTLYLLLKHSNSMHL